jgi:hypothetical protein
VLHPHTDTTAVLDASGLTEAYRHTVEAALPRGTIAPETFWIDLRAAVETFLFFEQRRTGRSLQHRIKLARRIKRLAAKLQDSELERRAESHAIGQGMISSGFTRRRNVYRAFFYAALCDLWLGPLQQEELRYSRSPRPGGPLIRFIAACVGPVMAAAGTTAPTPHTIAGVIDHERDDREERRKKRKA